MGDPDDFIVDVRPDAIIIAEQQKKIALYRDIFAEITAKAVPWFAPESDDPERVRGYKLPVGPIHRAAGDLNFQMFDGERYLSEALATIATLTAALEEARGGMWGRRNGRGTRPRTTS